MLDKQIKKIGNVRIEKGRIFVEDFEVDDVTCREVAALGMLWAIGELQRELQAVIDMPGGTGKCVVD